MSLRDADIMLYAAGSLVWLGAMAWLSLRRHDPLRGALLRSNRLDWVGVAWVVLVYLVTTAVVAGLVGWYLPEETEQDLAKDLTLACANAASFAAAALACLWLGRGMFRAGLRGFGLTLRRLVRDLRWAVVAGMAVWPVVAGLLWVSEGAVRSAFGEEYLKDHRVIDTLENAALPGWAGTLLILTAIVIAPLAEEFFFRGILQTRLRSVLGSRWAGVAVAGICFGLMHGGQVAAIVPLAVMGIILGFVYEATGSLIGPILIHAMFNTKTLVWHSLLQAT